MPSDRMEVAALICEKHPSLDRPVKNEHPALKYTGINLNIAEIQCYHLCAPWSGLAGTVRSMGPYTDCYQISEERKFFDMKDFREAQIVSVRTGLD